MPTRQFTKLWGLKKLKKIAQGLPSRVAGVAPYLVRPADPRLKPKDLEKPRLLIRTDERGKAYHRLQWTYVPRYSVDVPAVPSKKRALSRYIRMRTRAAYDNEKNFFDGNPAINPPDKFKHLRHIIHPTHAYAAREAEGVITITRGAVQIAIPGVGRDILYSLNTNRITSRTRLELTGLQRILLGRIIRFIRAGLKSKQINPKGERHFVLRYTTEKSTSTTPEFYDLQEFRKVQSQNKKKEGEQRSPKK